MFKQTNFSNTAATYFFLHLSSMNNILAGREQVVIAQQAPSAPTQPSDTLDQGRSTIHDQTIAWLTDPKEPTQLVGG